MGLILWYATSARVFLLLMSDLESNRFPRYLEVFHAPSWFSLLMVYSSVFAILMFSFLVASFDRPSASVFVYTLTVVSRQPADVIHVLQICDEARVYFQINRVVVIMRLRSFLDFFLTP